jgi:hypothetical protein
MSFEKDGYVCNTLTDDSLIDELIKEHDILLKYIT